MDIKFKRSGDYLTIYLYGELDEFSSGSIKKSVDQVIYNNLNAVHVVFDLSGVTFMDSTGIGLLIGRYKLLKNNNLQCYLTGLNVSTEKVVQLAGLYSIMPKL